MYPHHLAFFLPLGIKLCSTDGQSNTLTQLNSKEAVVHGCQTATYEFR
jgi:hypothetical protein